MKTCKTDSRRTRRSTVQPVGICDQIIGRAENDEDRFRAREGSEHHYTTTQEEQGKSETRAPSSAPRKRLGQQPAVDEPTSIIQPFQLDG